MRMRGDSRAVAGSEGAVLSFLGSVRRRAFWMALLGAALGAALVNEGARWVAIAAILWGGLEIPVVDLGPFALLGFALALRHRWSTPAAARRADGRLGLHDRLVSFLDFRARADLEGDQRRAQADETARALAGADPRAVVPLRKRLLAGPLLLAASMLYPLFFPSAPETTTTQLVQRIAPSVSVRDAGLTAADGGPAAARAPGQEESSPGETGDEPPPDAAEPASVLEPETPPPTPEQLAAAEAHRRENEGRRQGASKVPFTDDSPANVYSERVGTELAEVVEPLFRGGDAPEAPAPELTGSFAFHLLPKGLLEGAAAGDGIRGEAEPTEVVVDFDSLPEQYRPVVRAYFELLALRAGSRGGERSTNRKEP